jgi:hypothetical protein
MLTSPSALREIQAENEQECRWERKQLMDFYTECLERGAGTLTPDDRLCQGVERTIRALYNVLAELNGQADGAVEQGVPSSYSSIPSAKVAR